ncbi:MAG: PIN domain-containing protein [Prosthecobacter sp.]|uniref:type II toxin-antitoxin system VapC family toxin n=1 Tax=Prosthecobacter sp. TaxID=1965333 RepID=UPI0025D14D52|nr:PIN domain-containing protein [Prosthecobacter sp.]MCF7787505.1 PIN domain-containing protein [Prosthecobacter sp.]
MFVVLDTNHFREVAGATALAAKLESKISQEHSEVFLSIITVQEAVGGWLALINSTQAGQDQITGYTSFQRTITAFRHFDILPFDSEAGVIFHRLKSVHSRTGTMDLKIAAICLAHDAMLLTRNLSDFQHIPGLRVENWLD